jgi:hypothetical protein
LKLNQIQSYHYDITMKSCVKWQENGRGRFSADWEKGSAAPLRWAGHASGFCAEASG